MVQAPGGRPGFGGFGRTLASGTGLVLLLCAAFAFRVAIGDLWWGMTHHWRISCFGAMVELPAGWRKVDRPDQKQRVDLRNAIAEVLSRRAPDEISLWQSPTAFDPVEEAQRWERLETRLMVPGDRLEPTRRDAFLLAHARCSDVKRSADSRISFACFDRAGRWVAVFAGREQGTKDFVTILQSVLPMSTGIP